MLISILSLFLIAQSQAVNSEAPTVYEEPTIRSTKCRCPTEQEEAAAILEGLVVGAELSVAPSGRATNDRQATIFDIAGANEANVSGQTKIWHPTREKTCGITFDYGRKYKVAVRYGEDDSFETDRCLMRQIED